MPCYGERAGPVPLFPDRVAPLTEAADGAAEEADHVGFEEQILVTKTRTELLSNYQFEASLFT